MTTEVINVLLVEDSPTDALIVREELAHATGIKFVITQVERLAEAMEILRRQHFNVVLLDLSLPDSDGFDTFTRLRDGASDIPVVVLSGRSDEVLAVRAVQSGAQDYLMKGFMEEQVLARAIRYAIERQRGEGALRESQALYLTLVEQMPAGVFRKDAEGRFVFVNSWLVHHAGGTAVDYLGKTSIEVAAQLAAQNTVTAGVAERRSAFSAEGHRHHEEIMRTGGRIELDENWVKADGRAFHVHVVKTPVRDAGGYIIGSQGMLLDLTERKQAEDGLRLFRTLVDQFNDALEIIDPETGRFLDGNAGGYASLGYTREEFLARGVTDIDPNVAKSGWAASRDSIRAAGTLSGTTIHRRSDGHDFPVEYNAKWVQLDRDYIVTVVRDITQRKKAEQELQLLSSAVEQSTESILITNARIDLPGPEILFANPAFTRMTGYTATDVIGRTPRILQGPRTDPAVLQRLRVCMERGEVFAGQTINYRKDGTEFHLEWQVAPIRNEAGVVTHFVALQRDVTERMKHAEQSLRAQRLESIGMLAAGISHDLNNVLAPIGMAVSLLRTRLSNPSDLRMLDILEKSADRGAGLVRQILGFVHGIGGEPRVLQVKHLLHDISEIISQTFPKSIVLDEQMTNDLWPILANPTQIHQVLLNLCVNARDAMPQGGTLTLGAANCVLDVAQARVIEGAAPGAWLVLQVSDTGTGIPPELLERIWEPFFSTKPAGEGTGLGLPTVRGIIMAFHGFMTLQTEVGRGTTIRAYLPVAPADAVGETSFSLFGAAHGEGELILCVDDEQAIRDILGATLDHAGFRTVMACHGEEALVVLGEKLKEVALVITDLDMPRMGGEALARAIRVLNPAMKILVMSGITNRFSREKPCDFASAFVQKPFTVDQLMSQVQRLLHGAVSRSPIPTAAALLVRPGSSPEAKR